MNLKDKYVGLSGLAFPLVFLILFFTLPSYFLSAWLERKFSTIFREEADSAKDGRISLIYSLYEDLDMTRFMVSQAGAR